MEMFYTVVFGALAAVAASLELTKSKSTAAEQGPLGFWKFRANYITVYALMMGMGPNSLSVWTASCPLTMQY